MSASTTSINQLLFNLYIDASPEGLSIALIYIWIKKKIVLLIHVNAMEIW